MRQLLRKAGSLTFAVGALSLLLFNAAVSHGCGGARPAEPAAQTAPESEPRRASEARVAGVPSASGAADPDCETPSYMHATKAPVWMAEDECRRRAGGVSGVAEPAERNNAPAPQQQAP
jgi:hypothetical protein